MASTNAGQFAQLQGIWRSRGHGRILQICADRYHVFEETSISCIPWYTGSLAELGQLYEDIAVSAQQRYFSVRPANGLYRIGYQRLKALPPSVRKSKQKANEDPEYNFEVFWHTFSEHYALFPLKGVDWKQSYQQFRPSIVSDTLPKTLYETMTAMLRPLMDGHVCVQTPLGHFSAGTKPAFSKRLERALGAAGKARDFGSYQTEILASQQEIIRNDYLCTTLRHGPQQLVEWGRINDTTGYLQLWAMAGQSGKAGHPQDDLTAIDSIMLKVLNELGHLPHLIIDIRRNGGGYDSVALRFASYLIDRKRVAFRKRVRCGVGFTGLQSVAVTPAATGTYKGNLYILTSELTASAAEIFVLSLLRRPRLTLIGEPTMGILSDAMERHLPNGWFLTLSNEIYQAADGNLYEDAGIPPHIRVPFVSPANLDTGRDMMLDAVLQRTRRLN